MRANADVALESITDEAQPQHPQSTNVKEPTGTDASPEALREDILRHLESLGITAGQRAIRGEPSYLAKEEVRTAHLSQRRAFLKRELKALAPRWDRLTAYLADGSEVVPDKIRPTLVLAESSHETGDLFRLATTFWSVPVSRGFGRRMRYLVLDEHNGKLIGVFALGDPVFNLRARDEWIGWSVSAREKRLVNVMDAYVVGAVPPYNKLLGGKLVASLIGSAEVGREFWSRYGNSEGIISERRKRARLTLVTVTSALGRSSLYNRLNLRADPEDPSSASLVRLEKLGATQGFGHFHLSDRLFERLRQLLAQDEHHYVDGHQFGDGPNWRMRVARVGLSKLGLSPNLVRHGISREVFAMPLTEHFREILRGSTRKVKVERPNAVDIAEAALQRWVIPRAKRRPEYRDVQKTDGLIVQESIRAQTRLH